MAREPELSIKVKVDPQIKPTELKTSIERKVKQSGEKPQIDIDPNVDGIKRKIEDKLKNIKATANITPVVDTEKLKTDIQQQINGIGDIPKVTVGVNVDDFSDELSKRLKEELKSVNDKLSYYLKNLTTNTAGLNSVVEGLFPSRGISNAVQSELKSVQAELTAGLKGVKSKVKPFKETDLFQIGDTESTTTIRRVEKLVKNIRDQFASLDNFYDADEEKFLDGFNSEFEKFQNNASETVEKLSALKKNLSKDKFSDLLDNEDFDAESTTKALTPLISFLKKLSTTSIKTGEDYDNLYALFNNKNTNKLFDESNDHLTRMKTRVGDITAETKTAIEVTGELAKTLNKAIKDDNSGYLSDAEIKTYGAAFDEVLSDIATKQEEINTKKQRTVELENDLLTKTRSNREALKQELEEYKNLLKSFGVKGDEDEGNPKGKPKPKSKKPDKTLSQKPAEEPKAENQDALNNGIAKIQAIVFDINQEELQKSIDTIFSKVSAPIGFKPANGAIANIKQQLQEAFNDVVILGNSITKDEEESGQNSTPLSTSISGKVTITDADVIVDVKNPVTIPGTVTVDPTSVQFCNSDDLQKNASALSSVKQSLSKIFTNAEGYGTKIAAIGPSVQYVAQEIDNLSKSLENQITDLDLIAKKTDAYGTTANSVTLNTKDVAAPTAPVDIPGKVTLKVEDVTPPKDSVKIPGKVELEVSDITPPKTAVELEGKVSNVTVDNSAKGKKKNVKDDVKKPEVIDLKGRVELKDEDIKRPNPLNLNGAVKIKAADVKIDDVEISKKEFDIAGNLILKNAKIVDAVKEAAGEAAKIKKKNNPTENSSKGSEEKASDFDRKAKEAHLGWLISNIGENRTYLQSAISNKDSNKRSWYAGKIADYEKDFEETTRELIENLTEEEQDWIKSLKGIKDLDLNDPKQIDELMADKTISWPWEESGSYLNGTLKAANMAGFYNVSETDKAKKRNSYEKEYVELIKQKPALIKAAAEAKKQYGEDSDAYKDAVKAKKENEESLRAIKADRQKAGVPRGIVGGGYSNSPAVQSTLADIHKQVQKRRSELLLQKAKDSKSADDKQAQQAKKILSDAFIEQVRAYANGLKESAKYNDDAASESAKTARQQMQDAFDSANDKFLDLLDVLSGDEINQLTLKAKKELDSANIIVERRTSKRIDNNNKLQDNRYQNLIDNLSNKQKTYGTVEEAVAEGKTATDIQVALQKQQELVDKIAKAKVGTEEYNNAIQAAEENWKSVVAIIDTVEKKQKDLTKAVDSIEKKFYQLAEEASGSSNEKLKNSINGVITKAAALSAKNPNTYENYAVDYNELKRESYKANAQYTIWKSNYKKLEREGIKIAEGVEVARQMQTDGSLQNVKFDSIDNLLRQLNELEPQTDAYKEKLVEVKKIWEEIERKVKAVEEAENQAAKRESTKISNLKSVSDAISQNRATMKDVQKNYGTDYSFYGKLQEKDSKLKTLLDTINESSDPVSAAKGWAQNNLGISPDKINSVTDAINQLHLAYREATQEAKDFNKEASREKSINKASMEVANLKATIHDYIAEHKKLDGTDVGKSLYELLEALNQSDAPEKIGELKKKYAELRAESKKLGLESKNLLDVFEKLFGQHLSTMITMAALHKMQDALRIVYQNVVEIDTAVTELRKVSEYTGKSLEEYMGRAAEQAQKLGVSISDYVNSTADWKRLGYSDEDAENLATYSTLLRNVGDNIDDVNTSSSYLISTLQGFGLLADQAEDVVNKIDAVANTQPVTAKDLGEILTRSSAAMSAANNTLEETIALGTAANAVIQDADTVGTTLKSLSMYLRAAKSDAENAGIEVDGMANSVSELRSELKSLTGVDIMLDSKNFKSTYQIMKELSQVWSGLSDVTQANVTEMIGGKRNANAVSAILNNFDVAESAMESAANSANVAWEENEKYLDSINGRLAQLDASFQVLSQDVLSSGLVKGGVSFLTSIVKLLDKIINLTGALPAGLGITAFATQLGKPKMTGFMIVPSNTPGGDTEQVLRRYFIISLRSMREYLVKPTNMVA
jgi:TP901 family phage tail tape measure protein